MLHFDESKEESCEEGATCLSLYKILFIPSGQLQLLATSFSCRVIFGYVDELLFTIHNSLASSILKAPALLYVVCLICMTLDTPAHEDCIHTAGRTPSKTAGGVTRID